MPTDQPTELSDAMLRELLLLLEQGISPGRLRPEAINVARAILGTPPDAEGVFGNIPANLRRRETANEPSYALKVFNEAERWLGSTSMPSHPVGLTLGCFPAGIKSGCRKHLECPTEIEKNCPFRDESAAAELEARQKDPKKDVMPVLRRCQFLGCVRPERALKWLEEQKKHNDLPVKNDTELDASQRVKGLAQLFGLEGKSPSCSGTSAASHACLDSLCPHFRRSWTEPVPERSNEFEPKDSLNQHRFLQCSLSRPWPAYSFDPDRPATMRHYDDHGLPIEFGNMLRGLDKLPRPHGFTELPVPWLQRAGFSGVGVVVVDEIEKNEGVYYLQMGSTEHLLRDYYEMPYFWLGEHPGTPWPDIVRKHLAEKRPQYIQCLFRGHRQAAADPPVWEPELLKIFRDGSARWLAPFGRGRFLYCPDGEVSFFLLCLRLLRLLSAIQGGGKPVFFEKLLKQFQQIARAEIWTGGETKQTELDLIRKFNDLLNLSYDQDSAPRGLREELVDLGLLMTEEHASATEMGDAGGYEGTPRLKSLVAWLRHFQQVCGDNTRAEHFIPTDFLDVKAPEGLEGWFSLRDVVSRIGSGGDQWDKRAPLHDCVNTLLCQLDDTLPADLDCPVSPSAAGFSLRGIVTAIISVVSENLGERTDPLFALEKMILQIVRRGRFPLAGYYAWRSSGNRDFCLGHFAVPIGQGNPVTSREEEGQVPWREDQFFLAGINEGLLSGAECHHLFEPLLGAGKRLAFALEKVALLGRVLFSPLADSTINYTIFQKQLQNLRDQESRAAEFRAHQMNSFLGPAKALLDLESAWGDDATRRQSLGSLRQSLRTLSLENSIYLDVASGTVGPKEGGLEDYREYHVDEVLRDVVSRYQQWARDGKQTDREKPMAVLVEPEQAVATFPASYLGTILWELINNHQKHAPDHPTTKIFIHACVRGDELTVVVSDESELPVEQRKAKKKGYSVGQREIRRILRFMMLYKTHRECPMEPQFGYDESLLRYESIVRLDLSRLPLRFAPASSSAGRLSNLRGSGENGGGI